MKIIKLFLITFFSLTGCINADEEIFIVPENFNGVIVIVFDQEHGSARTMLNNKRVYNIPQSGILLTKFTVNSGGFRNSPMFYRGKISDQNIIRYSANIENMPDDKIIVTGGSSGSIQKNAKDMHWIKFVKYYIGNKMQIASAEAEWENRNISAYLQKIAD